MAYKIEDNSRRTKSEANEKVSLAIRFMLEDIHRTSTPKTPMSKDPKTRGQLRADVVKRTQGTHGSITWGKHYAWYQERGYTSGKVRKYTTPGTGAHFAENAVRKITRNSDMYFRKAGIF